MSHKKLFLKITPSVCLIFGLLGGLFMPEIGRAQSKRQDLETKRQRLLLQMQQTSQQLSKTRREKSQTVEELEALQSQIETREQFINHLQEEIAATEGLIERTETVIVALEGDIQRLRREYGKMMRAAYKTKMPNNAALYVLSAKEFNESYKKLQYFRQYDKFRKRQARLIVETQRSLASKKAFLTAQKDQKMSLIGTNASQQQLLVSEKKEKDAVVSALKQSENRLLSELKSAEKQNARFNSAISNLISEELEAKKMEAERRLRKMELEAEKLKKMKPAAVNNRPTETTKTKPVVTETPEVLALSSDFRSNKGRLRPPVAGNIVRFYGKQQVLNNVTSVNNGIDMRTSPNAEVRAFFNGTVSVVSSIAGVGNYILVRHGNYFSVYSNLSTTTVQKGETVTTGQVLGRTGLNAVSNDYELHFELWLERTRLDPANWFSK